MEDSEQATQPLPDPEAARPAAEEEESKPVAEEEESGADPEAARPAAEEEIRSAADLKEILTTGKISTTPIEAQVGGAGRPLTEEERAKFEAVLAAGEIEHDTCHWEDGKRVVKRVKQALTEERRARVEEMLRTGMFANKTKDAPTTGGHEEEIKPAEAQGDEETKPSEEEETKPTEDQPDAKRTKVEGEEI